VHLSEFILANVDRILAEWEVFARSIWPRELIDKVHDEPDARRMLLKVLEALGARVVVADSAAEALAKVNGEHAIDVLVSDLGMPDKDGYDLIREVRRHGHQARDLPAVALTGFARKDDAREAMLAGFQAHIPKPVDLLDLTAVIASLAGRTGQV
jgi:CheY-like chemotaxis protein